ncbi:RNA polymerase I termination factor [Tanacetum coccineum]
MRKTREDADASAVTMENKSENTKNKISDLQGVGGSDGNSYLETDCSLLKEKKGRKRSEKKKTTKLGSKEDRPHKGTLVNDGDVIKKDKKKKRKRDSSEKTQTEEIDNNRNDGAELSMEDSESEKIYCKRKILDAQNSDNVMNEIMTEESTPETQNNTEDSKGTKEKKKTTFKGSRVENKTTESVEAKAKGKGKSKKVSFACHVEVFPSSDREPGNQSTKGDGLIRGKRFTPEEDEIIKEAVLNYMTARDLGDDGLKMVLNCRSHPGMKKCWKEIATCIPYRPSTSVYHRAHVLFERAETPGFTPEELKTLKELHEKHGNNWKRIAEEMGKYMVHVKDAWRRIKLENLKSGKWSQEEYQNLHDLVNLDLQMKLNSEKKSQHGMLRDNIPWTAISDKLSTRNDATCCTKWYRQLTSSLVAEKKWCDADDYRMIGKLYELDAACVDDVDWDSLLEHRSGDISRKRWDQMVKHIGDYWSLLFAEQVDILARRYSPDLAETREAWDNKPVVS